jgi:hypothetical protein
MPDTKGRLYSVVEGPQKRKAAGEGCISTIRGISLNALIYIVFEA